MPCDFEDEDDDSQMAVAEMNATADFDQQAAVPADNTRETAPIADAPVDGSANVNEEDKKKKKKGKKDKEGSDANSDADGNVSDDSLRVASVPGSTSNVSVPVSHIH